MSARLAPRLALLAALALAGCGDTASGVELRLYPCQVAGGAPSKVVVAIDSYDAGGAALGGRLEKTFAIDDPAVFSDDYATVEFVPPAGTATADFTVTWSGGGVETSAAYAGKVVPKLGEVLVLGNDACSAIGDTTTSGPGSTGETTLGETTDGDTTTTGSTGDGTTGETTGTGTTADSTTDPSTSSTSTGSTGETTGGTTGGPMEGGGCDVDQVGMVVCDGGPGVLGTFLQCDGDTMVWTDANETPPCVLETACPFELGFTFPKVVGCLGDGMEWTCACADIDPMTSEPKECPQDGVSKCGEPLDESVKVELCVSDGDSLHHYVGLCPACSEPMAGAPLCEYP